MKKNGLKRLAIIAVIGIVAGIGISSVFHVVTRYSSVIKTNWDISIPGNYKEIYESDSGSSFHGDGIRYHVFQYKNGEKIDSLLSWSREDKATVFSENQREAAEKWLDEIQVPQEERPDYDACVFWYQEKEGNCEMILFWDQEDLKLYVVESFL